jgi:hypothetical protein
MYGHKLEQRWTAAVDAQFVYNKKLGPDISALRWAGSHPTHSITTQSRWVQCLASGWCERVPCEAPLSAAVDAQFAPWIQPGLESSVCLEGQGVTQRTASQHNRGERGIRGSGWGPCVPGTHTEGPSTAAVAA